MPHVYMDDKHTWQQNTSLSDLLINADSILSNSNHMSLGRDALSYLYLMINMDAGTFTVWPAFGDNTTEDLQAVDENNNPVQSTALCSAGTSAGLSSTPTSTPTANPNPPSPKISVGAIVGIAIGAVAILVLGIVGALIFKRQRKQNNNALPAWSPNDPDNQNFHESSSNREIKYIYNANLVSDQVPELAHDSMRSHEMPA